MSGTTDLLAESVSIDVRMEALAYVVKCVREHYGEDGITLSNVAGLVDAVARAVVKNDRLTALVSGSRLLNEAQVVELWHMLGGE